jgi:hypothetical protein
LAKASSLGAQVYAPLRSTCSSFFLMVMIPPLSRAVWAHPNEPKTKETAKTAQSKYARPNI